MFQKQRKHTVKDIKKYEYSLSKANGKKKELV
jgi:hypothetical protein